MEETQKLRELIKQMESEIKILENKVIDRKVERQNVDGHIWELFAQKYDTNKIKIVKGRAFLLDYETMNDYPTPEYPDANCRLCTAKEIYFDMSLSKKDYTIEIIEYYDNEGEYLYTDYDLI